jgi:Resolvase, N terminal domain
LDQLRPGDTLVVWKLDRLGRSLRHLVDTITELAERGIGSAASRRRYDTTTPGGKLLFHVLAALAEFERDLIREHTAAGLAGGQGLRPPGLSSFGAERPQLQVAREMYASGQYTMATIATTQGVNRARSRATSLALTAELARSVSGAWGWLKLEARSNSRSIFWVGGDLARPWPGTAARGAAGPVRRAARHRPMEVRLPATSLPLASH